MIKLRAMGEQILLIDIPATGKKASKAKPSDVLINRVNRQLAKRRYYLHKQLDKTMFSIDVVKREIRAPGFKCFTDIPPGAHHHGAVNELLKLGYKIQYELI